MAAPSKSVREKETEDQVKALCKLFERKGIAVRREKLARGSAFRVKSGDCILTGHRYVFVDRRLPTDQQLNVLLDYLGDFKFEFSADDLKALPKAARDLIPTASLEVEKAGDSSVKVETVSVNSSEIVDDASDVHSESSSLEPSRLPL